MTDSEYSELEQRMRQAAELKRKAEACKGIAERFESNRQDIMMAMEAVIRLFPMVWTSGFNSDILVNRMKHVLAEEFRNDAIEYANKLEAL